MTNPSAQSISPPVEASPVSPGFASRLLQSAACYLTPWPFGLRHDVLYLWATFRLRYRPFKMLMLLGMLGLLCGFWYWAGRKYLVPPVQPIIQSVQWPRVRVVLEQTSDAVFSSLNILSCLSIFIMARTLRYLLKQRHLESIQLVPGRLRPSALFYAITMRYLPLAFIAVLVIYLDKQHSPFNLPPFKMTQRQRVPVDLWPLFWAGVYEISILAFCVTNLFMDLALAFWIFNRFRITYPTIILAVFVIGLITPLILMWIHRDVTDYVTDQVRLAEGIFRGPAETLSLASDSYWYDVLNIANSAHYLTTSVLSFLVGLLALGNLDARWHHLLAVGKKDPVLLKPVD